MSFKSLHDIDKSFIHPTISLVITIMVIKVPLFVQPKRHGLGRNPTPGEGGKKKEGKREGG
jgi:hypothetical protein